MRSTLQIKNSAHVCNEFQKKLDTEFVHSVTKDS